jgi:hypothetical protein
MMSGGDRTVTPVAADIETGGREHLDGPAAGVGDERVE